MSYIPSTGPRLAAVEAALTALTRAVIELVGAVSDVASATTDPDLKAKLLGQIDQVSPLLDEAVRRIVGEDD